MRAIFTALTLSFGCFGTSAAADMPACITNIDDTGTVFASYFAAVSAPVDYVTLRTDTETLEAFADLRLDRSALMFGGQYAGAYDAGGARQDPAAPLATSNVTFHGPDGAVVHTCTVTVEVFDPQRWDLSQTQIGDCDLDAQHDTTQIDVGQTYTITTPRDWVDVAASPASVLGFSQRSTRDIEWTGLSAGAAYFIWLHEDTGRGQLAGLCPVRITP